MIKSSLEYQLILAHYGSDVAKRSQVPLINHIDEGLTVLDAINATNDAKRAFCLHPLLQNNTDLTENYEEVSTVVKARTVLLAMEYRSVANEYLSHRGITWISDIRLSPLTEVNDMLIADKVQNYKDFITYHRDTHPRSTELEKYFQNWLIALSVDRDMYEGLCKEIDNKKETYEQH